MIEPPFPAKWLGISAENHSPATDPSIGLGLNGVSDWTTQQPFLNVFKTSRPWTGHTESRWGSVSKEDMNEVLDENGYMTRMPDGATSVSGLFLTEIPAEMTSAAGSYRVTWEGQGAFTINGATKVRIEGGEMWFDYEPRGDNMLSFEISAITEGDHIRNVEIVHGDHVEAYDNGAVFNLRSAVSVTRPSSEPPRVALSSGHTWSRAPLSLP